jgi:iron complex transport system substrate-binding protein
MTITDDLGRKFDLKLPVRRIISLSPAIAENLFAIGAGETVVGVTTVDDYPEAVKKLPKVGDFGSPAYERIRALRPELAIVEIAKMDKATIANAEKRMGVPILVQMSQTYRDVPRHLKQLGQITGKAQPANDWASKMLHAESWVQKRVKGKPKVTVFVEVSASPLYTAGPGSFIDDLIRLCGGVNVVKGTNPFPQFSREALLKADPEHYIIAEGGDMSPNEKLTLPPPLNRLRAAREGKIHRIPADLLFRPTPRLSQGLMELERALNR